jgi:hypothetical protein
MATPVLIMGVGGGAKLLAYDPAAATDDGVAVPLRARSQELALSGAEAETSVFALLVVVTHTAEVALVLTPILDGVPQDGSGGTEDLRHTIALDAVPSRQTRRFELATETPIRDPAGRELGRMAQRGTFFGIEVDTSALASGELLLDSVSVEYEPAAGTLTAQTTP